MAKIYYSVQGSFGGGGPSVHVARMAQELSKKGHTVLFDKAHQADVAVAIINVGKLLERVDRSKTKVLLRCDGIYNLLYNEKFNRAIRPDMEALHADLQKNIPLVDHVVFQSSWSRDRVFDEIVKIDTNCSIINNGCDTNLFIPPKNAIYDGFIKLISVGKMRDAYFMEMLIGTYLEVKRRGYNARLILVGTMDAACSAVYNKYAGDMNIKHGGNFVNTNLTAAYNMGDIFLDVRQGSSSNNVVPEAQACGLPVITPSWGGDCEMIVDGKSGIVVDGGKWDYDARYISNLTDAVEKVNANLPEFKKSARQNAIDNLSTETMVQKYLKAMGL
jgi:glycosyltransferase involved in cell wall biosynthesis